ncbi:MAG: hypothetical protein V1906_02720 [Candidatus Woesearchaeota archaeon]
MVNPLIIKWKDKENYAVQYDHDDGRGVCVDITKQKQRIVDGMDIAGRIYHRLKTDYPKNRISSTPRFVGRREDIQWYLTLFEHLEDYLKADNGKFNYSSLVFDAVNRFASYGSVKRAFHDLPVAVLYSTFDDGRSVSAKPVDMSELSETNTNMLKYLLRELSLKKGIVSLDMSEVERIVAASAKQLSSGPNRNAFANVDYVAIMMKQLQERHEQERDEMLRQLRAANRWK